MKKFKLKELIDNKKIKLSDFPESYRENYDLVKKLTKNFTVENKLARDLDEETYSAMLDEGIVKKKPITEKPNKSEKSTGKSKKTTSKPKNKPYNWPHKMDPFDIKESIAQQDKDAEKSVEIVQSLDKDGETYFYSELVQANLPEKTNISDQKKDVKYLIEEYKKSKTSTSKYQLGDMWNPDFDYDGMILKGLSSELSWGVNKLEKLHRSMEDVNYHNESKPLWETIQALKNNNEKEARKKHSEFISKLKKLHPDLAKKMKPSSKEKPIQIKGLDNDVSKIIGKRMYFKPKDDKKWIQATIYDAYPAHKGTQEKWRLEFYPVGGKKWDLPAVSDILTSNQMEEFINKEEVAGKYTMKKPKTMVVSDFDAAVKEIDDCLQESKLEKARKQSKTPEPKKKTPSEDFDDAAKVFLDKMIKISKEKEVKNVSEVKKQIKDFTDKLRKNIF